MRTSRRGFLATLAAVAVAPAALLTAAPARRRWSFSWTYGAKVVRPELAARLAGVDPESYVAANAYRALAESIDQSIIETYVDAYGLEELEL